MTTAAAFYAALHAVSLSGVTNIETPQLGQQPILPCKWIDTLSLRESSAHKGLGGDTTWKFRIIVLVAACGQDTQANRWSDMIAMVDTLRAALRAMTNPTSGTLEWTVDASPSFGQPDGPKYFAVTADCEAAEWA